MIRLTQRRADTIYGLSEKSAEFRSGWSIWVGLGIFSILSLISIVISYNQFNTPLHKVIMIGMSIVKYIPLLFIIYSTAKTKAAIYLDDIYELKDTSIAESFIENVAFGGGKQKITINEGKISEEDERSPIILIGGPGAIKVNLGSAALLEQIDGSPRIISASKEPWKLNRFERIREIGEDDTVGKREYATINLQDQFVNGIEVKSRTKDGISIEAQDIKIIFSILRDPNSKDPYSFDRNAVSSLVYKQALITPPLKKNYGVAFPWDMTVIPLIIDEMERLISSKALSEILSSISQKEIDNIADNETSNTQLRVEITGQMTQASSTNRLKLRTFETRAQITDRFFEKAFKEKAKLLGITLHWIDVGTWRLPSTLILDNLKSAWELARDNIKRKKDIEGSAKKLELEKLLDLIQNTIIEPYESTPSSKSDTEELLFLRYLEKVQQLEGNSKPTTGRLRLPENKPAQPKSINAKVIEILREFRKEFIAARELIEKEHISPIEKQQDLDRIDRAIEHIEHSIFRRLK